MNSAELQFILRMKDEATAILNRVGGSLNNAGKGAKQFATTSLWQAAIDMHDFAPPANT